MKTIQTIDILGTKYKIIEDSNLKEIGDDGLCMPYSKVLKIRPASDMLDEYSSEEEKRDMYNEVLRHEIIHAFFFESGIPDKGDEETVEWMTEQFPKMMRVFNKADCIGGQQ